MHITAGIIAAGFVRTDSDVLSLPVMSLKMKKMIGAGKKPAVKDHITAGLWLENGSVSAGTHHCRFKPRADSDWALSLSVLAKNRR